MKPVEDELPSGIETPKEADISETEENQNFKNFSMFNKYANQLSKKNYEQMFSNEVP